MDFAFPENKVVNKGTIRNYHITRGRNKYEDIDIFNPSQNIITINHTEYCFTYLNNDTSGNKGGNSIILKLYEIQNINEDDIEYEDPDMIIKILKFPKSPNPRFPYANEKRFKKEIGALENCKNNNFQNVIQIIHSGNCSIYSEKKNSYQSYLYYTMEFAEYDLKSYVEEKHNELTLENKVSLCISLAKGLNELYSLGYYHRDIKPDNIFMVGEDWKIGDLGLISERNSDSDIDKVGAFIGPKGWISPEAMNKYLCENINFPHQFNCNIDHKSDIFQLGKVFWYIFQHNAPIGVIKEADFKIQNKRIYPIIRTMISHSYSKRFDSIDEVIKLMKPVEKEMLIDNSYL